MSRFAFYLDLDGVFADYEAGIRALGFTPDPALAKTLNRSGTDNPLKREMHEAIKGSGFYRTLPLLPGSIDIFNAVAEHDPHILTAAPKFGLKGDDYLTDPYWLGAAYDKRWWVEGVLLPAAAIKQMTDQMMFVTEDPNYRIRIPDDKFICTTSERKQRFMHRQHAPHQVLIDDREQNCWAWYQAGGIAIQHDPEQVGITLSLIKALLSLPSDQVLSPNVVGYAHLPPVTTAENGLFERFPFLARPEPIA